MQMVNAIRGRSSRFGCIPRGSLLIGNEASAERNASSITRTWHIAIESRFSDSRKGRHRRSPNASPRWQHFRLFISLSFSSSLRVLRISGMDEREKNTVTDKKYVLNRGTKFSLLFFSLSFLLYYCLCLRRSHGEHTYEQPENIASEQCGPAEGRGGTEKSLSRRYFCRRYDSRSPVRFCFSASPRFDIISVLVCIKRGTRRRRSEDENRIYCEASGEL